MSASERGFRLLVMDVDGTLVNDTREIPRDNLAAVERLQSAGILCSLATGRSWQSARPYIEQLGLRGPSILYNGTQIVTSSGTVLHQQVLAPTAAVPALARGRQHGFTAFLYYRDEILVETISTVVSDQSAKDGVACTAAGDLVGYVEQYPSHTLTKILLVGTDRGACELHRLLTDQLGGDATVIQSETNYVEVLPAGSGKDQALRLLCDHLSIPLGQTAAIGDNLNDLAMLQIAGLGAAPANAHRDVRLCARYVCARDNNAGAVAELAELLLSEDGWHTPPAATREP